MKSQDVERIEIKHSLKSSALIKYRHCSKFFGLFYHFKDKRKFDLQIDRLSVSPDRLSVSLPPP